MIVPNPHPPPSLPHPREFLLVRALYIRNQISSNDNNRILLMVLLKY